MFDSLSRMDCIDVSCIISIVPLLFCSMCFLKEIRESWIAGDFGLDLVHFVMFLSILFGGDPVSSESSVYDVHTGFSLGQEIFVVFVSNGSSLQKFL